MPDIAGAHGKTHLQMSRPTKGYLIGIVGVTFWSTTGVFIGYLTNHHDMPPLLVALWRDALVCMAVTSALFVVRRSLLRMNRAHVPFFLIYGLELGIFNSVWILSVRLNGAAVSTVLAYGSAGFTALLAWWFLKEQLGPVKIVAVILSLGGCVFVANAHDPKMWMTNPLALSVGLVSGLLFAIYNLMGKGAVERGINPWSAMAFSFGIAAISILFFNLIPGLPGAAGSVSGLLPALPTPGWLALVTVSFIPSVLGFGLFITSMSYLPASVANLLATLEPVMTAVQAYLLLGERMSALQIFGSALVIVAVVIVRLAEDWRKKGSLPREAEILSPSASE